jgi:4-hydroxy 2-oxovalerate aldolase
MKNVKLLDCTLREAPLDGLMWGDMSIKKMINGLENAGVDIIEVGFLKDTPYVYGSTSFHTAEDIKPYLVNKKPGVIYTALVDYGRYDTSALTENDGKSVDAIRVCFKHEEIDKVLDYAREFRDKGYLVCIQHVDTMGFSDFEIIEFVKKVNEFKPFAYSVVDTFGAMYDSDMIHYTQLAADMLDRDIRLGFHAHNNLMLADANDEHFVDRFFDKREIIVDSSLYGCGRSAGNAHTELNAQYMNRKHGADYNIDELLDLIDTVIAAAQEKTSWGYSIPYFIAGIHNAHTFNVKQLLKRHNLKSKDLRGIIERLDDVQKKAYDYKLLEKLYVEYFNNPVNDEPVLERLTRELSGKTILLLAPGVSARENREEIERFISDNNPIVIGVNNLIDGYKQDYVFYSGVVRYQNLQYQDYRAAGSPKIIVSSNIKTEAGENEYIVNYSSLIKYGWINIDSAAILLLRLLQKCGVNEMYAAGLDGYKSFGKAFYKNELDTGLADRDRAEHTADNISMMEDMKKSNPDFMIHFLTDSVYRKVFEGEH